MKSRKRGTGMFPQKKNYRVEVDSSVLWLQAIADCIQKIEYLKTLKPDLLDAVQIVNLDIATNILCEVKSYVIKGLLEFCEEWKELPNCMVWEVPLIIREVQPTVQEKDSI